MQRTDSLEKTLMLGKMEVRGKGDNRGWDGWKASLTWWTWVWVSSRSLWWTGKSGVHRVAKRWLWLSDWTDWLFIIGGQSIGASASASVLPTNIQGWFPLGLPVLISLLSWPGIKPSSPVLGARNLNHWTTRKVPIYLNNKHSLNF